MSLSKITRRESIPFILLVSLIEQWELFTKQILSQSSSRVCLSGTSNLVQCNQTLLFRYNTLWIATKCVFEWSPLSRIYRPGSELSIVASCWCPYLSFKDYSRHSTYAGSRAISFNSHHKSGNRPLEAIVASFGRSSRISLEHRARSPPTCYPRGPWTGSHSIHRNTRCLE